MTYLNLYPWASNRHIDEVWRLVRMSHAKWHIYATGSFWQVVLLFIVPSSIISHVGICISTWTWLASRGRSTVAPTSMIYSRTVPCIAQHPVLLCPASFPLVATVGIDFILVIFQVMSHKCIGHTSVLIFSLHVVIHVIEQQLLIPPRSSRH